MPTPGPSEWLAAAAALLAPPACVACRRPPARPGDALCAPCRAALPWLDGPRCPRCALPAPCGRCPMAGGAVARAWTPLAFEGPARGVVHALKFRGALGLADLMAAQMVATAPPWLLAPGVALVPVPTPGGRRRRRGFDHAARLAAAVGARTGLEVVPCLRRTGPAPRQAGARRAARLAGGRVHVTVRKRVPRRAVLIDDVHTTGAVSGDPAAGDFPCGRAGYERWRRQLRGRRRAKRAKGDPMISAIFIDRPRLAIVIAIVITIAGVLALLRIPVAQFPDIVPPQVQVRPPIPAPPPRSWKPPLRSRSNRRSSASTR